MTRDEILKRLRDPEDQFVERKGGVISDQIRKTVVAFANGVSADTPGLLIVGIHDDLSVKGISRADLDKVQTAIRRICEDDCFPPVAIARMEVLEVEGKFVVAAVIPSSSQRPHFTGHAFLRVGHESVKASASELQKLIATHNTKSGEIIRRMNGGERVTVVLAAGSAPDGRSMLTRTRDLDCAITQCDAHFVTVEDQNGKRWSLSLDQIRLNHDLRTGGRLQLTLQPIRGAMLGVIDRS